MDKVAEKEYIGKQDALKSVCKHCSEHTEDGGPCQYPCSDYAKIDWVPAADVRPVVKAHWTDHRTIEHDGEWYCSACGKEITIYMGTDRKDRYVYCPNCGADMREE